MLEFQPYLVYQNTHGILWERVKGGEPVSVVLWSGCRLVLEQRQAGGGRGSTEILLRHIQAMESGHPKELLIYLRNGSVFRLTSTSPGGSDLDELVGHICRQLQFYYPGLSRVFLDSPNALQKQGKAAVAIYLEPAPRRQSFGKLEYPSLTGRCGNFAYSYISECHVYEGTPNPNVLWSLDFLGTMRTLNLGDFADLTQEEQIPLLGALSFNEWFDELCVAEGSLSPTIIAALANIFETNTCLRVLKLKNNHLQVEDLMPVLDAIHRNRNSALNSFLCEMNVLPGEPLADVLSALQLNELNLSGSTIRSMRFLSILCLQENLTTLNLSRIPIEDPGATEQLYQALESLTNLKCLNLSYCKIPNMNAIFSAITGNLEILVLNGNQFQAGLDLDVASRFFRRHSNLRELHLNETHLSPKTLRAILEGLGKFSGKMDVRLRQNKFGSAHADILGEFLPGVTCIQNLDISENTFGSSAGFQKVLQGLRGNTVVEEFALSGCVADGSMDVSILGTLPRLKRMDLSKNHLGMSELKQLRLVLESAEQLKVLDLHGNKFGDKGAFFLARLLQDSTVSVTNWHVDKNGFSVKGWSAIAHSASQNPHVRSIQIPHEDYSLLADKEDIGAMQFIVSRLPNEKIPAKGDSRFCLELTLVQQWSLDSRLARIRMLRAEVKATGNITSQLEASLQLATVLMTILQKLSSYSEEPFRDQHYYATFLLKEANAILEIEGTPAHQLEVVQQMLDEAFNPRKRAMNILFDTCLAKLQTTLKQAQKAAPQRPTQIPKPAVTTELESHETAEATISSAQPKSADLLDVIAKPLVHLAKARPKMKRRPTEADSTISEQTSSRIPSPLPAQSKDHSPPLSSKTTSNTTSPVRLETSTRMSTVPMQTSASIVPPPLLPRPKKSAIVDSDDLLNASAGDLDKPAFTMVISKASPVTEFESASIDGGSASDVSSKTESSAKKSKMSSKFRRIKKNKRNEGAVSPPASELPDSVSADAETLVADEPPPLLPRPPRSATPVQEHISEPSSPVEPLTVEPEPRAHVGIRMGVKLPFAMVTLRSTESSRKPSIENLEPKDEEHMQQPGSPIGRSASEVSSPLPGVQSVLKIPRSKSIPSADNQDRTLEHDVTGSGTSLLVPSTFKTPESRKNSNTPLGSQSQLASHWEWFQACTKELELPTRSGTSLTEYMKDGLSLLILVEHLSGEPLRYKKNAVLPVQKIDNLNVCLAYLRSRVGGGNRLVEAEELLRGDEKKIILLFDTLVKLYPQ